MLKTKKPIIAIVSLTDCEGCAFAILDLGRRFLDLLDRVDLGDFHLIEDQPERKRYDIVFVEGSPVTPDNYKFLKSVREKTKILVALGTCATLGGVQEIKNYHPKEIKPKFVYQNIQKIANPKIVPLRSVVRVDFEIQGCPIDGEDFLQTMYQLLAQKIPKVVQRPVCYECQIRRYECLLQKGEPCLGPLTLGGCKAICLSGKLPCQGCRGPLPHVNLENFKKAILKIISKKEFYHLLEIYGLRDKVESLNKRAKKHKNKF